MRINKAVAFLLSAVICLSFTACNGQQIEQVSLYSVIERDFNFDDVYMETSIYSHTNSDTSMDYFFNNKNQDYMAALLSVLKEIELEPATNEFVHESENIYICFFNASGESFTMDINSNDKIQFNHNDVYVSEHAYEKLREAIEPFITESDKHYTCVFSTITHLYEYAVFDAEHKVIDSYTNYREPNIFANDNIVHMWTQWGTGTLARNAFFYDVTTGQKSPEYGGVTDYFGSLVSSTSTNMVSIYDMFSGKLLYTIDSFEYPLADFIENISGAYFTENGQLTVWYVDENNENRIQTFDLPANLN